MQVTKRSWIRGIALGLVASVALAGCGDDATDDDTGAQDQPSADDGASASETPADQPPISIGQVGNYSGAIPGLDGQGIGIQAWVKSVNAEGGIGGHLIELHTADAKGDPAAEVSQVTQVAEEHDVVAFAGMGLTTVSGAAPYIAENGIPVIGGNSSDIAWATNPYFYPVGAGIVGSYLQGFVAVPEGKSQVGLIYCKESPACKTVETLMKDIGLTEANGGEFVYSSEVSLAAPSFTAPCLAAKQAGVEILAVAFDAANIIRLAEDCAQQDFLPTYTIGTTSATEAVAASAPMEGAVSGLTNAPPFADIPEMDRHRAAMAEFFPDREVNIQTVAGWSAGLALGKAIENALVDSPAGELTSADILRGLGMIQGDDLGGMTPPLTFTSDGIQPQSPCAFSIKVVNATWVANGDGAICPPDAIAPRVAEAIELLSGG